MKKILSVISILVFCTSCQFFKRKPVEVNSYYESKWDQAILLVREQKIDEAEPSLKELYLAALESNPELSTRALFELGQINEKRGLWLQALAQFKECEQKKQSLPGFKAELELPARLAGLYATLGELKISEVYAKKVEANLQTYLQQINISQQQSWWAETFYRMGSFPVKFIDASNWQDFARRFHSTSQYLIRSMEISDPVWSERSFEMAQLFFKKSLEFLSEGPNDFEENSVLLGTIVRERINILEEILQKIQLYRPLHLENLKVASRFYETVADYEIQVKNKLYLVKDSAPLSKESQQRNGLQREGNLKDPSSGSIDKKLERPQYVGFMTQKEVHKNTIQNKDAICDWYSNRIKDLSFPIYSSYDIRDSGYKVTNVDANIYPAGFNNICPVDQDNLPELFQKYLKAHYAPNLKKIVLITEEHTQNPYYLDNVDTITHVLRESGYEVKVAFPSSLEKNLVLESAKGKQVEIFSGGVDAAIWSEFKPDLVISNNDFSISHEEWGHTIRVPLNPPRELGWYQRKKSRYFKHYNQLVEEFSIKAGLDPFTMRVETEAFENFDISSEGSRSALADKVNEFIASLQKSYTARGIEQKPFVFVKNNSGTYGLAVIKVGGPEEIKEWSYKSRKKMKAAKGGRDVEEVIIQEGIPSIIQAGTSTAEPVIYMVGCELGGGFLRTHAEKDPTESLNSPGALYKKLCMSDLLVKPEQCPMENVYGWSAKLGLLAIAMEAQEMQVTYQGFINAPCGGRAS